ncbi:inositol monophosphatase family protein [uncultured Cohaesibacter sp.]|uniref:inositol monophosphatase family protein n=1 Tax=uncultured Cohaesibacter sp. TaxID=1002546 RepID=UPI0029316479|nr:inositol monophosphatase family protein [uncultured Cohaesibacter sp.]
MTDLLDGIVEAALCASEIILDIYETEFDVEMKTDNSPVTLADQKAEEIILAHLSQLAPDIPVVAEESTAAGDLPQVGDDFFFG